MKKQKSLYFISNVLLILFVVSCTSTSHEYFLYKGIVEENSGEFDGYSISKGNNTILIVDHFSHIALVPTAWDGYTLVLEIDKSILHLNQSIKLPNKKVKILFFRSKHHPSSAIRELNGNVKITEITKKYIVAHLEISLPGKGQLDETGKFEIR